MSKMVGTVFKVLGISIIGMIALNIIFIIGDTTTVKNRVDSLAIVMQDELSRNNAMPSEMISLFSKQLEGVKTKSNIVTGVETNMTSPITVDGQTYPALNTATDYGTLMTLIIKVDMEPHLLMYTKDTSKTNSHLEWGTYNYSTIYKYEVPALRVLK